MACVCFIALWPSMQKQCKPRDPWWPRNKRLSMPRGICAGAINAQGPGYGWEVNLHYFQTLWFEGLPVIAARVAYSNILCHVLAVLTLDEMAGWHHRLDGHDFEWTPGVGDGQGGLACCDSWGHKESDTTEWLNWTELSITLLACEMTAIVW